MGILSDMRIRDLVWTSGGTFIDPFAETCPPGVVSYGLSSYGYDMRLGRRFKLCAGAWPVEALDPKLCNDMFFRDYEGDELVIPPHGFVLAESVETFAIPRNVMAVCVGKSTYARLGAVVGITPLEPEWRGKVTIEISNTTPMPVKVYAGEGIAQVLFFEADDVCAASYADKKGIYQNQNGLTMAGVRR